MADTQRQAWMTEELEQELKAMAAGGLVTCEQVQEFAERHNIEITKMKPFVDAVALKVSGCRGLCT